MLNRVRKLSIIGILFILASCSKESDTSVVMDPQDATMPTHPSPTLLTDTNHTVQITPPNGTEFHDVLSQANQWLSADSVDNTILLQYDENHDILVSVQKLATPDLTDVQLTNQLKQTLSNNKNIHDIAIEQPENGKITYHFNHAHDALHENCSIHRTNSQLFQICASSELQPNDVLQAVIHDVTIHQ